MQEAYQRLHRLGHAHSVETWVDGELVGGLYGLAIGTMFYGESMFSLATDASKIALAHLVRYLDTRGFGLIDCQRCPARISPLSAHAKYPVRPSSNASPALRHRRCPGALAGDGAAALWA